MDDRYTEPETPNWRAEIGSDASMSLRAKLKLFADRVRDAEADEKGTP